MKTFAAIAIGALLAVGVCNTATAATVPSAPITFGSTGDSISAYHDNNGKIIPWSWVRFAIDDGDLSRVTGYTRAGADTKELFAHAVPIPGIDVMVLMAGTNDITHGIPTSSTLNYIAATFAKTGGEHKILSAVAPRNNHTAQTNALNYWLARLAKQHGWTFIDPWTRVRAANGTWVPGWNADSVHPTPEAGSMVGAILHNEILTEMGQGNEHQQIP